MSIVIAPLKRMFESRRFERNAAFYLLLLAGLGYVLIAVATGQMQYLTLDNLVSILGRTVALGITAIGQTFAILIASIDLSVASLISAASVLASVVMNGDPGMIVPAILAVAVLGAVVGLINGVLIAYFDVNPLIATLAMSLIIQGILSAFVTNFAGDVPEGFQVFAYGTFAGVPYALILMLLLALGAWFVLRHTRFGANIYSVGGNPAAARSAGIRTSRVIISAHLICSLCAALAGIYLASRLRAGAPWIGADGVYDLESIAVVVIGGTVLSGGRGGIWGTMAGVMIFSLLDSIFNLTGVDAFVKQVLRGVIIVGAVALYSYRSGRIAA
ncbi:ABC transporter permease [Frigidibacter sp. ROC022]|uniref:ABC transporter permease n=1 Tax=Frigidibacter sp. ROC022 TaxID=2971796 RepID=UPI00215B03B3|nr:ABC transporter permease [Frigidibacter sp. ROC022]MCR8725394.1 ABC transporter permease [Frigidibacter sp. ROC022]